MVTFFNPQGPELHLRTDWQNDHTEPLVTLFALCFAVRLFPQTLGIRIFLLRIHAVLPHGKNIISPYQKAILRMPNLSRPRAFGCRIYALSTGRHEGKVTTDSIICGKLLGYGGSMKNFIYINDTTRKIGRATHASFDEAQLSTPVADLKLNSLALWGALNRNPGTSIPPVDEVLAPPTHFCVFTGESPFLRFITVNISIKCTFESLDLMLEEDPMFH
jgi:hypothetical protein